MLRHKHDESNDMKHEGILKKWMSVLETINLSVNCSESKKDKTPICRYFERGYCREGENCRFQHGEKSIYKKNNVPV